MKHREFVDKMARIKPLFEKWASCGDTANLTVPDLTALAKEFGYHNALVANNAIDYYRRHYGEPVVPLFADCQQRDVSDLCDAMPADDFTIESLRTFLICDYMAGTNRYPQFLRQRFVKLLMQASGLDHFNLKGKWFIHWKHKPNTELCQENKSDIPPSTTSSAT